MNVMDSLIGMSILNHLFYKTQDLNINIEEVITEFKKYYNNILIGNNEF